MPHGSGLIHEKGADMPDSSAGAHKRSRQEVARTNNPFPLGDHAGVLRKRSTIFLRLGF